MREEKTPTGTRIVLMVAPEAIAEQLPWALNEAAKLNPLVRGVTPEQVLSSSARFTDRIKGETMIEIRLGGIDYFRGALKAAMNLLGALRVDVALSDACDSVREFIKDGSGEATDMIRWVADAGRPVGLELGPIDHVLALHGRPPHVDGCILFFGAVAHVVRLGVGYDGPDFTAAYIVDPLREADPAELRDPPFDPATLPVFDRQPRLPNEDVWASMSERLQVVGAVWERNNPDRG
ncbi:MAG: hypothetical protein AB1689_26660 [Thermodesulfobacteriota bacterium]